MQIKWHTETGTDGIPYQYTEKNDYVIASIEVWDEEMLLWLYIARPYGEELEIRVPVDNFEEGQEVAQSVLEQYYVDGLGL
jgi:hypothetical protein